MSGPIGSFIFMVTLEWCKTELAKALAEYLFNDENAMVRIDMSNIRAPFLSVVERPPGYVG